MTIQGAETCPIDLGLELPIIDLNCPAGFHALFPESGFGIVRLSPVRDRVHPFRLRLFGEQEDSGAKPHPVPERSSDALEFQEDVYERLPAWIRKLHVLLDATNEPDLRRDETD